MILVILNIAMRALTLFLAILVVSLQISKHVNFAAKQISWAFEG